MTPKRLFTRGQEKAIRIAMRTGQFGKFVGQNMRTATSLQRMGIMQRRRSGSYEFQLTRLGRLVAEAIEKRGDAYASFGGVITGTPPEPVTHSDTDSNPIRSAP